MKKAKAGVTLIELIVAMSLMAIIFSVISPMIYKTVSSYRTMKAQVIMNQDTTAAFLLIERLIENISYVYVSDSDRLKIESDGSTYDFTATLDGGTSTYRMFVTKDSGTPRLLLTHIKPLTTPDRSGFKFSYFNQNYEATTTTTNVRTIEMSVIMQMDEFQQSFKASESIEYEQISL